MYLKINQIIISYLTLIKWFFNCITVVRVFNYTSINFTDVTIHVLNINKLLLHFNNTTFGQYNIKVGIYNEQFKLHTSKNKYVHNMM